MTQIVKWIEWGRANVLRRPRAGSTTAHPAPMRGDVGEYRPLYVFLRDRYANRVVMTFAEIEELLMFPLPESARGDRNWWANAARSTQSFAWTLTNRTADVNLSAKSVAFDQRHDET